MRYCRMAVGEMNMYYDSAIRYPEQQADKSGQFEVLAGMERQGSLVLRRRLSRCEGSHHRD